MNSVKTKKINMQSLPHLIGNLFLRKKAVIGGLLAESGNDYWRYFHRLAIVANCSALTDTFFESDEYSFIFHDRDMLFYGIDIKAEQSDYVRNLNNSIMEGFLHPDTVILALEDVYRYTDRIEFRVNVLIPVDAMKNAEKCNDN